MRVQSLFMTALAAGLVWAAGSNAQQAWPSRPLSAIFAGTPGDPGDVVARLFQNRLSEKLGQPWVVEARGGASGRIATGYVARANDQHTVLFTMSSHFLNPASEAVLPYDTLKDFVGVSLIGRQPMLVGAHPSVKGNNLKEFIAAAKADPSMKLAYASPGPGTLSYLVGELVARRGGIDMVQVPFRGGSPAVQAVNNNDAQMTSLIPVILMPHIKAGVMKPMGVSAERRLPELPDVPTFAEMGLDAMPIYNFIGVFAPSSTPKAYVDKLNAELTAIIRTPAFRDKFLTGNAFTPVADTVEAFTRFIAEDRKTAAQLVEHPEGVAGHRVEQDRHVGMTARHVDRGVGTAHDTRPPRRQRSRPSTSDRASGSSR